MGQYVGQVYGNNAAENVLDATQIANERATKALSTAERNLRRLSSFGFYVGEPVNLQLDDVDTTPVQPNFPDKPVTPSISLSLPDFPPDISFEQIPQVDPGVAPTFDKDAPTLVFPARPTPSTAVIPDAPLIDTDNAYPDAPIQVIPDVPTLIDLNIPDAPIINLPVFTEVPPTQNITVPGKTFNWSENPYSSQMLDALSAALLERIQGGTGLSVTVEQQIWDRERTREEINKRSAKEEVLANNAQSGFSRPTGSTQAILDKLALESEKQKNSLGRDIAIKQAELEQQNLQQTIQSIISIEQVLIDNNNKVLNRALDAEKFSQQIYFDIYNAEVAKYNVELETYRAYVLAFETQLKSEIQKLEVYKTELEGQKLIGDLNQQFLALYTAELQGLQTEVDLYRSNIDAINSKLQGENLKIQIFKSEVDAFSAEIQAKNAEYQGYAVQVSAEETKMNAYTSEVRAFASRVDAYSKGIDASRITSDIAIATENLRLQQQSLKLDAYSKNVNAEVSAFQSQTFAFNGLSQMYSAETNAETARINTELRAIDQRITHAQAKTSVALENAKINLANIQASSEQGLAAVKATADVSASLAASSLAGINVQSSVGHSLQLSNNLNEQYSFNP